MALLLMVEVPQKIVSLKSLVPFSLFWQKDNLLKTLSINRAGAK